MKNSTFYLNIIFIACLVLIGCKTPVATGEDTDSNLNPTSPESDNIISHSVETEMSYARCNHTAVRLKDGRVFVVGGNEKSIAPSSEIFNPIENKWSLGPKPLLNRQAAKSILLDDGRGVIVGGEYTDDQGKVIANKNIEIYDPRTNSLSVVAQQVLTANGASLTKLPNGKVLILGGSYFNYTTIQQVILKGAEIFDPISNTVSPASTQMAVARAAHTATLMPDNQKVIVIGGVSTNDVTPRVEVFSTVSNGLMETNPLRVARSNHFSAIAADGRVIVIGGNNFISGVTNVLSSFEAYMSYGAFELISAVSVNVFSPSYLSLANGKILIAGGRTASNGSFINSVNLYDPQTNNITASSDMIRYRQAHTLTQLDEKVVLAVGGASSSSGGASFSGCLKSSERLDLVKHH